MVKIIAITGIPSTGKTTLANTFKDHQVIHTDEKNFILPWSEQSQHYAARLSKLQTNTVIEGIAVPRILRKVIKNDPSTKPVDTLIILEKTYEEPTKSQAGIIKSHNNALAEILPKLQKLGVVIKYQ